MTHQDMTDTSATMTPPEDASPRRSSDSWRRASRHTGLLIGAGLVLGILLMALLAPVLAPHDPYLQDLDNRLVSPIWSGEGTWVHPLGTDALGRDYLSRLLYGARISLLIGFGATAIAGVIGTTMGVLAGYFGGKVDFVVTFIVNVRLALPAMLVALVVVALVGGSLNVVIWTLGLLVWDRFAVVMRAATQQIRTLDYLSAARAAGASVGRILLTEVMPNVLGALIVVATLEIAQAILFEAALSFLGLGVQPPTPSWGLMISEGKSHMFFRPWVIALPGAALFILVLAINLLGDGIRDVTAPEGRT
ncbi:Glutathione transport system permease protein GsiD (plasmid) [Pseudooceanicola algae]|uniref:Glutathione transport system permease protein GsiD n=2 Tax=Pseudooceanicola algae TaxID=1537215 RepID=A0A418SCM4_9RHOB|nr:Glutathione transport system permease protein GsiD [Pseudooceanicola algae]